MVQGERATSDADVMALYERTVDDVYRYASRLTGHHRAATEELVQETYLALVRHVRREPEEPVDVGWLIVTCRHRFLDDLRGSRRRQRRERLAEDATTAAAASPRTDDPRLDAVAVLPSDQRAALVLRYVDDLPVPEVARALGRSVHATESLLARARTAVRTAARGEAGR